MKVSATLCYIQFKEQLQFHFASYEQMKLFSHVYVVRLSLLACIKCFKTDRKRSQTSVLLCSLKAEAAAFMAPRRGL